MVFPVTRLRRNRASAALRSLVREVEVNPSDFVAPLFLVPGSGVKKEISSLPGQFHFSVDTVSEQTRRFSDLGIKAVLLFAIPEGKDDSGSYSWKDTGIVQEAIAKIKGSCPELTVITDLCFCEYTSHGHCGIMKNGKLDNDATLEIIHEAQSATRTNPSHARILRLRMGDDTSRGLSHPPPCATRLWQTDLARG